MQTGAAVVIRDVDLEALRGEVPPEILSAMVELDVRSLVYVPLKVWNGCWFSKRSP